MKLEIDEPYQFGIIIYFRSIVFLYLDIQLFQNNQAFKTKFIWHYKRHEATIDQTNIF